MGLKSKLSKMKNFLFDEEEVEKPDKKKEKTKKLIEKSPKEKVTKDNTSTEKVVEPKSDINDFYFDDISDVPEETIEVKSRISKESTFNFPEYNDNDFMTTASFKKEEKSIEVTKVKEEKPLLYQGSKRREETKRFKPSPIISPIYGLLDESGNEVKKSQSKDDLGFNNRKVSDFDEVRNRAYGKVLDEKLENTISRLSGKTIEEAERDMQEKEKSEKKKGVDKDKEEDDMILPDISFKEIDIDKVTKKERAKKVTIEDDEEDTKEQDLFNLIDTIYKKEGNDE